MSIGSRVCPFCGKLNAVDEAQCVRCGRQIPPTWALGLSRFAQGILGRSCPATRAFIALSLLVSVALALGSGELSLMGGVLPIDALRWGALTGGLGVYEPWRYLSAMFVHFGLLHVGLNAWALHSLGRGVEQSQGWARLTLLFLVTGIVGFVASDLWPGQHPLTGGISGGVFGLLGAFVGQRYAQGDPDWKRLALTGLGYAAAMALMMGGNVNNAAHLGGLVSGAAMAWALFRHAKGRRAERIVRLAAIGLLVAAPLSIGLSYWSVQSQLELRDQLMRLGR